MKTQYEKVFVSHVGQAIERAKTLGVKATWSTEKHLDALAEVVKLPEVDVRDAIGECYNISAYQQMLAKKFEKLGHFQREGRKSVAQQADDVFAELLKG
jgi:DNA-binding ferritin-like protein